MRKVYLDYAATTYIDPRVLQKMKPYLTTAYGNASSLYSLGREAKIAIEKSRQGTAKILGALPQEIIFTGSGTESDNLAISGIAHVYRKYGDHIVVSKIEHKAVLESVKKLEKEGFLVTYLNADSNGIVKLNELKKALNKKTILVSIMYANNEIGTIQPIKEIGKIISNFKKRRHSGHSDAFVVSDRLPTFHTDACQAAGALSLKVNNLGVDLLTLNGSKIYGPKGVGCLYVNRNYKIEPLVVGGNQEMGMRAGTENTALIVGFAEALKLAERSRKDESQRLRKLRNYFVKETLKSISRSRLNGHSQKRLPNNINISFAGIEGESLVLKLDRYGISSLTGSACTSSELTASHVLLAIGLPEDLTHGSLRISLGRKTTKKDLDYVLKILPRIVAELRQISAV
jgi:cysteine desulfurase